MRRYILCWIVTFLAGVELAGARGGAPFFVNYPPTVYHAHNRNFDIVSDDEGRVYAANFEGVLYSDQTGWHVLHTPGIFRVTRLYKDSGGRIWVGGYNLFGYLAGDEDGELELKLIFSSGSEGFLGEVTDICEEAGRICVTTSIGGEELGDGPMRNFVVRRDDPDEVFSYRGVPVNRRIVLPDGSTLLATAGRGFVMLDRNREEVYALTEENGLCDNNVNSLYADSLGYVWGATDNGLFLVNVRTAYTYFRSAEGLLGEALSVCYTDDGLYVGTLRGLFRQAETAFEPVGDIRQACWQLQQDADGSVYASTAGGLYVVCGSRVRQITDSHLLSAYVCADGSCYTGEVDGVYHVRNGKRHPVNNIEKATCFYMDADSALWVRNIYGQVFRCGKDRSDFTMVEPANSIGKRDAAGSTLYQQDGNIYILSHVGLFRWNAACEALEELSGSSWSEESQYPQFVFPEGNGRVWSTNNEGKELYIFSRRQDVEELNELLRPVRGLTIGTLEADGTDVWMGGNFGLIHWDASVREPDHAKTPQVRIRRITVEGDSVIWGGFGQGDRLDAALPFKDIVLNSGVREISVSYSSNMFSALGTTEYRYRLDNKSAWSDWSAEASVRIANPRSGHYLFQVEARDRYGRITEPAVLPIAVRFPVYVRWYSIAGYVLLLAVGVWLLIRWRMRRLLKEKMRLESIVEKRTSQLRRQKDEIEEKSRKLETALDDLGKAQYQLIRQEKMATVGALTKGLVDRILNPMNYVNNFSHMSLGLVKDLKDNLDDDRENMTPDIYEDSSDALGMLGTNLRKIEEHGLNTTRILKAMEEMLKERTANMILTDIAAICRKNIEMLHAYYAKEIAECGIRVEGPDKETLVVAEVDAEQFSKTVMSILANSVYAVRKKRLQGKPFEPLIRLAVSAEAERNLAKVSVYDNGTGIEASVVGKVFDPFFTTKTTAEAVGVGMYLSREIILNHGGDITVSSVKDEYTEFVVSVPIRHDPVRKGETDRQEDGRPEKTTSIH